MKHTKLTIVITLVLSLILLFAVSCDGNAGGNANTPSSEGGKGEVNIGEPVIDKDGKVVWSVDNLPISDEAKEKGHNAIKNTIECLGLKQNTEYGYDFFKTFFDFIGAEENFPSEYVISDGKAYKEAENDGKFFISYLDYDIIGSEIKFSEAYQQLSEQLLRVRGYSIIENTSYPCEHHVYLQVLKQEIFNDGSTAIKIDYFKNKDGKETMYVNNEIMLP